jgi:2-succinyl-6-hydroxy-2,4-cyclohexadiene-1-carboxylate synthase
MRPVPQPENLVLLHGFGGTRRTWDGLLERLPEERYTPLVLDLPGHGELADAPLPITFEGSVASVLERSPQSFVLCGYSLGGRLALHVALAAPPRVRRLVLVSSTAGIEDGAERSRRRASDELLAERLERGSFEEFLESWSSQPLFADDPAGVRARAREDQLRNHPAGLAASLRGVGAGQMEPLWDRLPELPMPVLVLAGERDAKFRELGERMAALLPDSRLEILPGGHRLTLESPAALAAAITLSGTPLRGQAGEWG